MKCLIVAAVACASLTATATAAPPAGGPAACRSRIDEIFSDNDDYTARDFCNDIIGGQSLDDLAFKKIPGNTPGDVREKCGGEDTVKSVCGGITGPTGTAAPPAGGLAACRSRIDEIFSDNDDYTARDFCNDIIGGQSLDDLAFKKIPGNTPGDVREKCGGEDTVKSVCGTENFCETFNPADWPEQEDELKKLTETYGFANTQACFDAHDSEPTVDAQEAPKDQSEPSAKLPWVEYDKSSPSLTFKYATSQSSSDNWIGIWPKDDTQAPTWGSTTWDYAKESSGSLQLTPPSSMKAGKYKAYLLSSDRTILAFLSSFDYKPESSSSSSSVAFSVKMHYNTNCGGSVNNNVDINPGNGVCVRTNCDVGSLEIPSVGSCPDGQVRISYWQNADCGGDWYGYGYGSRGTCRGLWSNGWGFKSLWISCADPASDCIQQGTCTAAPEPATEVCRAGADTKPDAADKTTTDNAAAFHLKTRYSGSCTGAVHNEVTVPHGNGQCIDTGCAVGSLDIDSVGNCPDGELRISYWDQPGCGGKWYGYGYASRNTCRSLWSGGWNFKSLWVSCAKQSDDCVSRGTCTIDDPSGSNVC